ncbi:MAG TPA: hypothetical protein VHF69_11895 [Candidatus Synoicihabitans sp.]|nr:hypothetical protein [Candidatus Synoicihabitans sp.]
MTLKSMLLAAVAAALSGPLFAATIPVSGTISANTTWSADNTYVLSGYVFVANNATLTIQPGTVIKGAVSSGTGAAALVITRGAKIMAEGTADQPIVFTSELDQLNGNLTHADTGLWGGLVVLGHASINSRADGTEVAAPIQDQIEGFSVSGDQTSLITFGGTNDDDNSGVIRYVSIRHGGAVIGTANEINGLTLGGVGRGTTIEYVEVFANKDDSVEFFGGTVNARYIVSAFGNDDSIDFDQGYRGNVQFVFSIQTDISSDRGDKGIEWDGSTTPLTASPKAVVTVANGTFIGVGNSGGANTAINIRDAVEAKLHNSIFVNFSKMLDIEDDVDDGPNPIPVLTGNVFWSHVAANNTAAGLNARPAGAVDATAILAGATNTIADPALRGISYTNDRGLNPLLPAGSPYLTGAQTVTGSGLTEVAYRGAFGDVNWANGWTKLAKDGYFSAAGTPPDIVPEVIAGSTGKPINISTRGLVGTGDQVLIGGFVVGGTQRQTLLIRAVGPTIGAAPYNVSGVLADPTIELYQGQTLITTNDNHPAAAAAISARAGAFPLPAGSADAVIVANLDPGVYSAVVKGKNNTTGVVLLEIYEVD